MLRLLAPVLGLLLAWAGAAEARMHAPYRGHRIVATGGAPLDTFTTPFAAYSFRKLRSAYTGPGIRLRRASDNAELDIGFLGYTGFTGAPLDVAAANAHCAATTCVVQTWYDQSGNARHVSNGTPANQPAFTASCSGLTGQPCITATSSAGAPKQLYTAASHTPVNPVSFSAVGRRPAGTALSCNLVEQYSANMLFVDGNSQVRDWRNRNRIKTPDGGAAWLTVPVLGGRNQLLRDAKIDNAQPWIRKHLQTLERSYGRAPHFGEYFSSISSVYSDGFELLSDLDIALTRALCSCLGIETRLVVASEIGCEGTKDHKLLAIVQRLQGDVYLSGPSAAAYLDPSLSREAGVELRYKDYSGYPVYEQISRPFEPSVSVLDTLFMLGKEAPDYIWGRHRFREQQVVAC